MMLRIRLFAVAACASAFLPSSPLKLGAPTCLRAETSETEDDNLVVDDAARASLEKLALMTRSSEADEGPPRPKSSGTARRRRAEERKLVEGLGRTTEPEQFKAAIDGLWSLWFSERGSENKAKLESVDRLISEGEASQWVRGQCTNHISRRAATSARWRGGDAPVSLVDFRTGRGG
jgi:hypothetical protein